MKALSAVALALLAMGGTVRFGAGVVYLNHDLGQRWAGDPTTADYTYVGTSATVAGFGGFTDIDFAGNTLYGLDPGGNLYTINTSTGQIISKVGSTDIGGAYSSDWLAVREEFFGRVAAALLQLMSSTPGSGALYSINKATGVGTFIGQLGDPSISQPFTAVYAAAYDSDNGVFYGYDEMSGDQFEINTANPGDSSLDEATFHLVGGGVVDPAAIFGAAFIATPEPSTFVLIGSALIPLAVAVRRRKARQMA